MTDKAFGTVAGILSALPWHRHIQVKHLIFMVAG